jgi:hypothetical protein
MQYECGHRAIHQRRSTDGLYARGFHQGWARRYSLIFDSIGNPSLLARLRILNMLVWHIG